MLRQFSKSLHCSIAELSAITNLCGEIIYFGDKICLKIQLDNYELIKKCFTILKNAFNIDIEVCVRIFKNGRKNKVYALFIRNEVDVVTVLKGLCIGIFEDDKWRLSGEINPMVVKSNCCNRSYIRGSFLCNGSLSNPVKNYHLEFVCSSKAFAVQLQDLISVFDLEPKLIERKEYFVVYLKEGEQIADLLKVMEAHISLMEFENIRITKEVRNDINRKVNCEAANISKVVNAAIKQVEDIMYIDKVVGIESLPENLREIAEIRLQYQNTSLKELGTYLSKPVGKSGVNHRLKKLSILAETIREEKGE